ncbi:MAG TPA: c-type cytochrome [Verrucomicrobiota bacterium]|nr:c-type cytochrome [Verrucomicrobiota bacterium]
MARFRNQFARANWEASLCGRLLGFGAGLALMSTGLVADEPLLGARVPPTEPDQAVATMVVRPGFRAELVAAEPLVASPVAVAVDEQGRAFVVEMRDYSERRPERLGRIRRLTDTDQDGRYDHATEFLTGLPWPTAVVCWNGGVFIGATPDIIYAKDTNGDGLADVREVVFTGFAEDYAPFETNRLNVQALMNSFQWGLDARLHGATSMSGGRVRLVDSEFTHSWRKTAGVLEANGDGGKLGPVDLRGRDFSWDPRTLELRAEAGGGQHGMSFDSSGRKFVCSNSDHLQLVAFDDTEVLANRFHELPSSRRSIAADGAAAEVFRRSPDEPWRVVRTRWRVTGVTPGMIEGGGRASGYFTGATGVTIYRGDAYAPELEGDAFIADCGSNLIHRKRLRSASDGVFLIGERVSDEQRSEFLASTDNWFRPVQFYNAPDGCLWVVDMYREVIEHPWSLPAPLKARLDLDSGRDRGRIWRIAPVGFDVRTVQRFNPDASPSALVMELASPNGWVRDTAARLIYEHGDSNSVTALQAQAGEWSRAFLGAKGAGALAGRIQLLYLLSRLGGLEDGLLGIALGDPDPAVRRTAVKLAAGRVPSSKALTGELQRMASSETNALVGIELAWALAELPPQQRVQPLAELVRRGSPWVQSAAIHAAGDQTWELWSQLVPSTNEPTFSNSIPVLSELLETVARHADTNVISKVLSRVVRWEPEESAAELILSLAEGFRRAGGHLSQCDREGDLGTMLNSVRREFSATPAGVSPEKVKLLSLLPKPQAAELLVGTLTNSDFAAVHKASLEALSRLSGEDWARLLAGAVTALPGELRTRVLALLVTRPEGARELLRRILANEVSIDMLDATTVAALRNSSAEEVRNRARDLLGDPPSNRPAVIEAYVSALRLPGNSELGGAVFRERCATCHAWRGEGVALGPDLASVVANGREKLLVAILDPNREVAPNFAAWTAETASGEAITGIMARKTSESVTLRQANGLEATIGSDEIRALRPTGRSMMPEGLEAGLTPEQVADILAFLGAR